MPTAAAAPQKLYEPCPCCGGALPFAEGAIPPDADAAIRREVERIILEVYKGKNAVVDVPLLKVVGALLEGEAVKGYSKSLAQVDFDTPDAEMLHRLTRDTWHFAAAKNYQQMRDLTLALVDDDGKARSFGDFAEAAKAVSEKYNRGWLLTEYNSAVGSATMAARWVDFSKNEKAMPYLQYQTVGDDRVRDSHRALDGTIRKMADGFWNTHYPPNGWGCRCDVVQLATSTAKEARNIPEVLVNPLFRTNLAKSGLIYPKNHPYYEGVPFEELKKAVAYLPPNAGYKRCKAGDVLVDVHLLHFKYNEQGVAELTRHLSVCSELSKLGYKDFKLLPEIHEKDIAIKPRFYPKGYKPVNVKKNPDCWMRSAKGDDMVCDFKVLEGSGRNLAKHLKDGAEQASYVVVRLTDKHKLTWSGVNGTIEAAINEREALKGVVVLNHDGSLFHECYKK